MSAALRIDGLTVEHQRAGAWHRTLEDLSLAIAPGEAYGLIGASGSGKTTLGLAALHYLPPTARIAAGHIAVAGLDLGRLPPDALRRARGRTVGAVYQHPGAALNPMLRIGRQITEVLELHRDLHGEAARQAAAALLADMQLAEPATLLDRYPH
ncbi:MAG TPA: ATP-binding cassette domain-containing protein, partial [Alphaproteobacteria bacterium]|nr:ATP-binding cassette domain-containing protein [Alphaproteobacteria bacterium]